MVASILAVAALGLAAGCQSSQPSPTSLRENYGANRAEFESVVASGQTHGDLTVARAYSSTPTGTVPARLRERYKDFIRKVGAQQIGFNDGDIDILSGSEGLAVSGVEWGYLHTAKPPDGVRPWSEATAYRDDISYFELGDDWYVYVYRF